jgi:hypothetical protein
MIEGTSTTCTVTEISVDTLIKILRTAINLGEITGNGEFKVVCAGFISCTYNEEGLVAHGLGAELPTTAGKSVISEKETHKVAGVLCPSTAKLDETSESLADVYIST